jgi:putative transposase
VLAHRRIWPVVVQCAALGVSRSGFYAWLSRPPSWRSQEDAQLTRAIRASFLSSDRTYGARRVWHDLLAAGVSCGLHRVERLMRSNGFRARPRRRKRPTGQCAAPAGSAAPNLLERDFGAAAPNRKWAADFTYLWTAEGWLYVAVVLDLFSRRVVGWSMQGNMGSELVCDALLMALHRRGAPTALLHHSDQGSQYASEQFQRLLASYGIVCSMSRRGDVWDNSAAESFFAALKTERCRRWKYRTRDEARADVFDYIERWYNPQRRHSSLGYLSPVQFEEQAEAQQAKTSLSLCP